MTKLPGLLLCALLTTAGSARADRVAPAEAEPPIEASIAAAKAADKPLVLEFYTTWCKPCKEFKANVLPRDEVRASLGSVHFVQYDAEHGHGVAAAKRYKINGYPTFVVIDGRGSEVLRDMGSMSPEAFIAFLGRAELEVLDEAGVRRKVAAAPHDPKIMLGAARWHRARKQHREAVAYYHRAAAADLGNEKGIAALARWEGLELARYQRARADLIRDWSRFVGAYPTAERAMWAFGVIAASGELPARKIEGLARLLLDVIGEDAARLNGAVYTFLAAGATDAAVAAAERQVALLPKEANPYDSLAEALHYAGRRAEAVAAAEKALAMAPPGLKSVVEDNLERFKKAEFTPGYDVEMARWRAARQLAELPIRAPDADQLEQPKRPARPDPNAERRAFTRAARLLFDAARDSCKEHRGKLPEVYVRLEMRGTKRKVVVLEPGAPRKLVRCLRAEIATGELPEMPAVFSGRLTLSIDFAR